MSEPVVRVLVVAAAIAVAIGVALGFRLNERRRVAKAPLDLGSLRSAVTLFSDAGCANCDQARAALVAEGVNFEEFRYDHHKDVFATVGVSGVPLIVVKDQAGDEVGRIAGRASPRAVRRLVASSE
ncbi:MAG TPA: glutaredoxin domain-containing protein [Acidimicrobiia bacterium]|nr:glutaredoxin domain-containing protein [Acidimicrobiia bacterium]